MIGLTESLTSFSISRDQVSVLTIGCGDDPYTVGHSKVAFGGMWHWKDIIRGAMRLQSQNALGQAGLLIGPERMIRIDVPKELPRIELDDWRAAVDCLPNAASAAVEQAGDRIAAMFLSEPAEPYEPLVAQ